MNKSTISIVRAVTAFVFGSYLFVSNAIGEDWAQWRGSNRDGNWTESGIRDQLPSGQLPLDWSVEISAGYSGPTVAAGRVFVMDRKLTDDRKQLERIHCFDSSNGNSI